MYYSFEKHFQGFLHFFYSYRSLDNKNFINELLLLFFFLNFNLFIKKVSKKFYLQNDLFKFINFKFIITIDKKTLIFIYNNIIIFIIIFNEYNLKNIINLIKKFNAYLFCLLLKNMQCIDLFLILENIILL